MTTLKDIITRGDEEFKTLCPFMEPQVFDMVTGYNHQSTIALLEGVVELVEGNKKEIPKQTGDWNTGDYYHHFGRDMKHNELIDDITTPLKTLIKELKVMSNVKQHGKNDVVSQMWR